MRAKSVSDSFVAPATFVARRSNCWWQIVAGAAQGEATYAAAAGAIMDSFLTWLEALLPLEDPAPGHAAQHILTLIEGAQMLEAIGHPQIADAALAALPSAP